MASYEPMIREMVDRFIKRLPGDKNFDLVADFSNLAPLLAIMHVIGFPEEHYAAAWEMADDLLAIVLGHHALDSEELNTRSKRLNAKFAYLQRLVEDRMASPRDDLISVMLHNEVQGKKLSPSEVVCNAFTLLSAAWETTSSTLASTVAALLEHREQWAALARGEADVQSIVPEGLRYDTPAIGLFRTASVDTAVGGVRINKGDRLILLFASANHDPANFEDPERFRIDRESTSPHLAFGHDIHHCVGAALAKAELVIMLESLTQRFPLLRRVDHNPLVYKPMSQLKAPAELWVAPS
ncbi:cytochrome P450 [Microbispora sp. KK1-11]|nr:cytochrome P450 [Microbispora sp. KK1-11]TQS31217.1 cytochrome P450 [Microbispora sp. KK1-11]